jgi:hypothetical protein
MLKKLVAFSALLLALTIGIIVSPTAANAATPTCQQWNCDNTDPSVTHCADSTNDTTSAYITNGVGQPLAFLELRWGLICHTNWGKITKQAYGNFISVRAYRSSPYYNTATYGGYASSYYGDQVYGYNMTVCVVGRATDITNPQSPVYQVTICG